MRIFYQKPQNHFLRLRRCLRLRRSSCLAYLVDIVFLGFLACRFSWKSVAAFRLRLIVGTNTTNATTRSTSFIVNKNALWHACIVEEPAPTVVVIRHLLIVIFIRVLGPIETYKHLLDPFHRYVVYDECINDALLVLVVFDLRQTSLEGKLALTPLALKLSEAPLKVLNLGLLLRRKCARAAVDLHVFHLDCWSCEINFFVWF